MSTLKFIFLGCVFISLMGQVTAQVNAMQDSIMSIKGKWTRRPDHYDSYAVKSLSPVMIKKLEAISQLIKQAYPQPTGLEAIWYAHMGERPLFNNSAIPYTYRSGYFSYYYNTAYKKIMKGDETGTWAYVFVNQVTWLFGQTEMFLDIDGKSQRRMWLFPRETGEWKGYTLYEPYTHDKFGRAVVVARDGQVPWKPISQQQYLAALRKRMEKEKQESLSKAINDDFRKKFTEFWDKELKTVDDYLNNTDATTLSQQAIVTNWRIFHGKFATVKDKGAYKLVYADEDYFKKSLPSHTPQFMVLYWRWNEDAPGRYFRSQLESNFPIQQLKAMIE